MWEWRWLWAWFSLVGLSLTNTNARFTNVNFTNAKFTSAKFMSVQCTNVRFILRLAARIKYLTMLLTTEYWSFPFASHSVHSRDVLVRHPRCSSSSTSTDSRSLCRCWWRCIGIAQA